MRSLIAEDEPLFRQLLQKMLSEWGYEVVVARDGSEACEILLSENAPKLATGSIDILILSTDGRGGEGKLRL